MKRKPNRDFLQFEMYKEKKIKNKTPTFFAPLFNFPDNKNRLSSPSLSSLSDSDYNFVSDCDDSEFSQVAELSLPMDAGLVQNLGREVSKRVVSGMVLSTKYGERLRNISENNLGKRIQKFLERPVPQTPTISPRQAHPARLTSLTLSRQQPEDAWCIKQHKVAKILSRSLRDGYVGEGKPRYIRAPLTPIPSIDWVFDH